MVEQNSVEAVVENGPGYAMKNQNNEETLFLSIPSYAQSNKINIARFSIPNSHPRYAEVVGEEQIHMHSLKWF